MSTVNITGLNESEIQKVCSDWKEIAKPILKDLAKAFKYAYPHLYVSKVIDEGDSCDRYSEKFSFHIAKVSKNRKTKIVEINLELNSSEEYEGEFSGWGIMLSISSWDGRIGPQYAPDNYASECWQIDWEVTKKRTENIRNLFGDIIIQTIAFHKEKKSL